MMQIGNVVSLTLEEAAAFLGMHPQTLQERARAGIIPGAKIGKEWRFLDADLTTFLRSQYKKEQGGCLSTNEKDQAIGGTAYPIPMGDQELENQLKRLKDAKRKKSMIKDKQSYGKSKLQVVNSMKP